MRLLKKTLKPTKENANIKKNLCPIHKIIKVFQLLVQSDEENLLAHMIEITAIYV